MLPIHRKKIVNFVGVAVLLSGAFAVLSSNVLGQIRRFERVVTFESASKQAALRLQAADRLAEALRWPDAVGTHLGCLAAPPDRACWFALAATLAEPRTNERARQALEDYEQLLFDANKVLVPELKPVSPVTTSVELKRACHVRIARLPRWLLRHYRRHVDAAANKLFREGQERRDAQPLRRLVDDMFCCSTGARALGLLGDFAFENGRFAEALMWWTHLDASANRMGGAITDLQFPDPPEDPARIQAKQILALIFLGRAEQARQRLNHFKRFHGFAEGTLAGQKGMLGNILESVLAQATEQDYFEDGEPWSTFAGNNRRMSGLHRPLSARLWSDGPTWRVPLPGLGQATLPAQLGRFPQPRFHPVIANDQVMIADSHHVRAYHLLTGRLTWEYLLLPPEKADRPVRAKDDARPHFTLTTSAGLVFARLGVVSDAVPSDAGKAKSHIVCLDVRGREGPRPRELWRVSTAQPAIFEGAPIVRDGRVYFAESQTERQKTQTWIRCLNAETGKQYWRVPVCETAVFEEEEAPRVADSLLSLTANRLLYCNGAGAVVAIDPWTGAERWSLQYPEADLSEAPPVHAGLGPCVCHYPYIYLAPADSDRLFCLHADTGKVQWQRERLEVVHIIGAYDNRLLLATRTGLRTVQADSGLDQGGWMQPGAGELPSLGRGLVAAGWYFWPTQDQKLPYRAVTLKHGVQQADDGSWFEPTQLRHLVPGNMAFAGGCLVIAGREELVAYVAPSRMLKNLLDARKDSPVHRYQLARASAWPENWLALRKFPAWSALATQQSFDLQLDNARSKSPLLEGDALATLAEGDFPAPYRLQALQASVRYSLHNRLYERAFQTLIRFADRADVLSAHLLDEAGVPHTGASFLRQQLAGLRYEVSPASWQQYEKQATQSLAEFKDVGDLFPATQVRRQKLLGQAQLDEKAKRYHAASQAHRRLLAEPLTMLQRKQMLDALARLCRLRGCRDPTARNWSLDQLPLRRQFHVPASRLVALFADSFLTADGNRILCRDLATGTVRWRATLFSSPVFCKEFEDLILCAGADGIEALHADTGKPAWTLPAPTRLLATHRVHNGVPYLDRPAECFHDFQLDQHTLYCLQESRRLLAIDVRTGNVLWIRDAPDAAIRPLLGAGRFAACYRAFGDCMVLFTVGGRAEDRGRRWILSATSGEILNKSAYDSWVHALAPLDGPRFLMGGSNGRVSCAGIASGNTLWEYQPEGEMWASAEPPTLRVHEDAVLAVLPSNLGWNLLRLDAFTGRAAWAEPILLADFAAHRLASDKSRCYFVQGRRLECRSLADGKSLWKRDLPARGDDWHLQIHGSLLLAYPANPPAPIHWPSPGYALLNWSFLQTNRPTLPFSAWLIDASTGTPLQQLAHGQGAAEVLAGNGRLLIRVGSETIIYK